MSQKRTGQLIKNNNPVFYGLLDQVVQANLPLPANPVMINFKALQLGGQNDLFNLEVERQKTPQPVVEALSW